MSEEDDRYALNELETMGPNDSVFGVSSCRWADAHGVVHRMVWAGRKGGWTGLCGVVQPREVDEPIDPGMVTCIGCVSKELRGPRQE